MSNSIAFTSLGCSRNLVDTEVMLALILKNGYEIAKNPLEADYHVINTCGFLEAARQEAIDTIQSIFSTKKPSSKVIVAGCMVMIHQEKLKSLFPDIHYFLGSGDVDKVLNAIRSDEQGAIVTSARSFLQEGEVPRLTSTPKHYAYLKIAEGCKKQCAFCIIPKIKGKLKSKSIAQVQKEFQALLNSGTKEIILIAQDLGDFGKDRFEYDGLAILLKALLEDKRDFWIRLLYLYPDEITDSLIEVLKNDSRVLPYLDMPLQHINDSILKAMFRKTSKQDILSTVEKLRKEIPSIVIRTSLMCGFPGETEEHFEELLNFVKNYKLDNIGIFAYSNESLAHSSSLPNHVDEKTKQNRVARLGKAQARIAKEKNRSYIGKTVKAIVDGPHPEADFLLTARFYGQCPEIDGVIIINEGQSVAKIGDFIEVEITDSHDYDLLGKALRHCEVSPNTTEEPKQSRNRSLLHILDEVNLLDPHESNTCC